MPGDAGGTAWNACCRRFDLLRKSQIRKRTRRITMPARTTIAMMALWEIFVVDEEVVELLEPELVLELEEVPGVVWEFALLVAVVWPAVPAEPDFVGDAVA
jgi:hypothetical protein